MNKDLFGNEINEEADYIDNLENQKSKKISPFDFIGSVSETKKDIVKDDPDIIDQYSSYVTNRGFGYFPDTVLYANEMNLYPDIPKKAQYYYYFSSLRKKKRRSKWFKLEENPDIELIKKVYNVRAEIAKQYLEILTEENLDVLRNMTDTGEIPSKKKKK